MPPPVVGLAVAVGAPLVAVAVASASAVAVEEQPARTTRLSRVAATASMARRCGDRRVRRVISCVPSENVNEFTCCDTRAAQRAVAHASLQQPWYVLHLLGKSRAENNCDSAPSGIGYQC